MSEFQWTQYRPGNPHPVGKTRVRVLLSSHPDPREGEADAWEWSIGPDSDIIGSWVVAYALLANQEDGSHKAMNRPKFNVNREAKEKIREQLDIIRTQVEKIHLEQLIPGDECRKVRFAVDEAKYQVGRIFDE